MPMDFGAMVLKPNMDVWAINLVVTPIASQPNAPPYPARGIWREKPTLTTLGGDMLWSSTEPTLGISLTDTNANGTPMWAVPPMKDDQVQILPGQPVDRIGSGYFTIIDPIPDGQTGMSLKVKDRYGPGV